jgi:hypothetical protein
MSFGDLWEPRPLFPSIDTMSTAIVRIYTPDGFVIAAEGRKYNLETKTVLSGSVQKIFPIEDAGKRLAYTISGTVELTPKGSSEVVFDCARAIHHAIEALATSNFKSLWHYGEAISKLLAALPEQAHHVLIGDEPPTIISLAGYYKGRPKEVEVKMFYDGQDPKVSVDSPRRGYPVGCGSFDVLVALLTGTRTELLQAYRTPFVDFHYETVTFPQSIEVAKNAVAAQCDPEALQLDPMCIAMGGHIHLCTITPDAFRWVIEPLKAPA